MSAYVRKPCGCVEGPSYEAPPGVAFTLSLDNAATKQGWRLTEDDCIWRKACAEHDDYEPCGVCSADARDDHRCLR